MLLGSQPPPIIVMLQRPEPCVAFSFEDRKESKELQMSEEQGEKKRLRNLYPAVCKHEDTQQHVIFPLRESAADAGRAVGRRLICLVGIIVLEFLTRDQRQHVVWAETAL